MLLWYRCGILPWTLKPCQKAVIRKDKKNSYTNSLHPSGLNILNTFELSWTFLKTSIFQIGCKIWQIWHSEIVQRFDVPGELMESVMPSSMPAMWRWGGVCIAMFTMFTMFAYCNILQHIGTMAMHIAIEHSTAGEQTLRFLGRSKAHALSDLGLQILRPRQARQARQGLAQCKNDSASGCIRLATKHR